MTRKQNELNCPCYPLSRFDWHNSELVCEASDLGRGRFFGRLYANACDEGFEIASPSGRVVKFYLHETHRDAEGEVTHWMFKPVTTIGTVTDVTVFND